MGEFSKLNLYKLYNNKLKNMKHLFNCIIIISIHCVITATYSYSCRSEPHELSKDIFITSPPDQQRVVILKQSPSPSPSPSNSPSVVHRRYQINNNE